MTRARPHDRSGFVLISSYLMLFLFFIYSNALTVQTITQRTVADRAREDLQALNLAQGALAQLGDNLYYFVNTLVPATIAPGSGDVVGTFQWIDGLVDGTEVPAFDVPEGDRNGDGLITTADGDGVRDGRTDHPVCMSGLPTIKTAAGADPCPAATQPAQAPRAWVTAVTSTNPADPFAPRRVTLEAEARVGAATKRLRANYVFELGNSDIFRYAYFINNFGWFDLRGNSYVSIHGEVRSNADLDFRMSGGAGIAVNGDLYASQNPQIKNPKTMLPATGTISGDDPSQANKWDYLSAYGHPWTRRPIKGVTYPGQPKINGATPELPYGAAYDADYVNPQTGQQDQRRFTAQPTHTMPFLGDLGYYENLAAQTGGRMTYWDADTGAVKTVEASYKGPDGQAGTADDQQPLVLLGTWGRPIIMEGPVVIPGDVLISGVVLGRGTVYSGRNVHVLWGLHNMRRTQWKPIRRDRFTGEIRASQGCDWNGAQRLGTVCTNGSYFTPAETEQGLVPPGCMQ